MHDVFGDLSELRITAYHEAGHTVAAQRLEKPIVLIILYYRKPTEEQPGGWWGYTQYATDVNTDSQSEQDAYTITFAGPMAEELLYKQKGKKKNPMSSQECSEDINAVNKWIERKFPLKEQEQERERERHMVEERARAILGSPTHWHMVEYLAEKLVDAIESGSKKPSPFRHNNQYLTDVYTFTQNEVYDFLDLARARNSD